MQYTTADTGTPKANGLMEWRKNEKEAAMSMNHQPKKNTDEDLIAEFLN